MTLTTILIAMAAAGLTAIVYHFAQMRLQPQ